MKKIFINSTLCALLLIVLFHSPREASTATSTPEACGFGITSPYSPSGYPLQSLNVGSYLDWSANNQPVLPNGMEHVRVLRLRNDLYASTKNNLPGWLEDFPGATWIIGNEPDTTYSGQDDLLAETYADRFYELAQIIRLNDKKARIAFGTIVQPTPIRMRYLDKAWTKLKTDAGGEVEASALIDIWAIHSFILNELGGWGTGIPRGFENDHLDAFVITDLRQTYSISLFRDRVKAFRTWMKNKNQQNKPLWITEYGSLIPPIDPPGGEPDNENITDTATADFMADTLDFMLTERDPEVNGTGTGYPADEYRLVQRWFWYSLNDHRYHFGGSLFDPDDNKNITQVGSRLVNYQAPTSIKIDTEALSVALYPINYTGDYDHVNYLVKVQVGTARGANAGDYVNVSLAVDGVPVPGSVRSSFLQRCGGSGFVTLRWNNISLTNPIEHHLQITTSAVNREKDPTNNVKDFSILPTDLRRPLISFLPLISR